MVTGAKKDLMTCDGRRYPFLMLFRTTAVRVNFFNMSKTTSKHHLE